MTVVRIQLGSAALGAMRRPVVGQGGFQSLLRRIQRELGDGSDLLLTVGTIERIARYVERYGEGGFQGRLRYILDELRTLAEALRPLR
jgi:hypothetical protein